MLASLGAGTLGNQALFVSLTGPWCPNFLSEDDNSQAL